VTGEKWNFRSKMKFSKEDTEYIKNQQEIARCEAESDKRQLQKEMADKYNAEFLAIQDSGHVSSYLTKKKVASKYMARMRGADLVIPMYDLDKKIWGYQVITESTSGNNKWFQKNQRITGTFHAIPSLQAVQDAEKVFICEGWATAASIYEATDIPCVVAFNAGNLESVYRLFYKKKVVICGDDDQFGKENRGRKEAANLDSKYDVVVVFPKFRELSSKPTDFNDLRCLDGLDEVRRQLTVVEAKPPNEIIFLGISNSKNYHYYTTRKKQVITLAPSAHTQLGLAEVMTRDEFLLDDKYCSFNEEGLARVDYNKIAEVFMATNQQVGVYNPSRSQGAGVWKEGDKIVLNMGSKIYVDGEVKDFSDIKTDNIFINSRTLAKPSSKPATVEQMTALANLIGLLSFKNKNIDARLFLGWLFVAPLCGALPWRPHLWLTGATGSGKSTIFNKIAASLLAGLCRLFQGAQTTEAGIRQKCQADALPILIDELETDDKISGERVRKVIDLIRISSSDSEAKVVKGSAGGNAVDYDTRFMAMVCSIRTSLEKTQDRNRFVVLELDPVNNADNYLGSDGIQATIPKILTAEFRAAFFARSIKQYDVVLKNIETFYPLLSEHTKNARLADQYSVLMAGYFAALQDEPVDKTDAMAFIKLDTFGVEKEAEELKSNESEDCVNLLLDSKLKHGHDDYSVSRLIQACRDWEPEKKQQAFDAKINRNPFQDTLMTHGIKVEPDGFIAVHTAHPEIKKIYRESKWCGSLRPTLMRNALAKSLTTRYFGKGCMSVFVHIAFE